MNSPLPIANRLKDGIKQIERPLTFGAWGALGGAIASLVRSLMITFQPSSPDSLTLSILDTAIAFGLLGACVGLAIFLGYFRYFKRGLRVVESLKSGALIGLAAGCLGGVIAEVLFRAFEGSGPLHVAVWGITGGLIGIGLSFRIPNLDLWTGLAGGAVGGVIGGAFSVWFTVSLEMPELLSRFFAFAAIGFFIPFALFLVEAVFRGAAAAVQAAPRAQPAARPAGGFSLRLSTGKILSLADGMKLSTADIPGLQASTAGGAVAEVARNPNDPNVLGLKNLSRAPWSATLANQNRIQVAPGRNVRIAAGTKISFGSVDAEIQ
jgi:hypothetical protein